MDTDLVGEISNLTSKDDLLQQSSRGIRLITLISYQPRGGLIKQSQPMLAGMLAVLAVCAFLRGWRGLRQLEQR